MIAQANERAAELWRDGARWDAVVATLRTEGFSKIDCIKATAELLRLPLDDAKRLVHNSAAWADVRQRDDAWHETIAAEADAVALRD